MCTVSAVDQPGQEIIDVHTVSAADQQEQETSDLHAVSTIGQPGEESGVADNWISVVCSECALEALSMQSCRRAC
jgi:hypothetical protein